MGLISRDKNVTFVDVNDGKFVIRSTEDDPEAVSRTIEKGKNAGRVVYEKRYDALEGLLVDVEVRMSDYGERLTLSVRDEDMLYKVTVPFDSKHAGKFIRCCENLDVTQNIKFSPFKLPKKEGDGYIHGWGIRQLDDIVSDSLKKEDIPEWKQIIKNKKKDWDRTEELEFLQEHLSQWVSKVKHLLDENKGAAKQRGGMRGGTSEVDLEVVDEDDEDSEY